MEIYTKTATTINLLFSNASSVSSVAQSCPTLCNPMNCSTPGLPVHHQLPEFTQTHVHWVGDTIQPSHPLSSPSPPAPNPSQHQSLFQWVNFTWGGQSTRVSALASFLPKNTQDWFLLEWTGWISFIYIFQILFHYRLLQDITSSLCYAVGPCWLSNAYIVVYIC